MLGLWLAASPFIFGHDAADTVYWMVDLSAATLVVILSLLSYWEQTRYAHLGTAFVGVCLMAFVVLAAPQPPPPAAQNEMVLGLLLAMLGIIPNEADEPPRPWREMESAERREGREVG